MPGSKEQVIQNAIIQYLHVRGVFCWRNNTGALRNQKNALIRFGVPGSSDILGILPSGKFLAIECKTQVGRVTDLQHHFLDSIKINNGVAIVARSLDDVISALEGHL